MIRMRGCKSYFLFRGINTITKILLNVNANCKREKIFFKHLIATKLLSDVSKQKDIGLHG